MINHLTIAIIVVLSVLVSAITLDERKELLIKTARECKEPEAASETDVELLVTKQRPQTREGKCLSACFLDKLEIMKDEKLSRENFLTFAGDILAEDSEKMRLAVELADECMHVKAANRCDMAFKTSECIRIGSIVKKVDFGF